MKKKVLSPKKSILLFLITSVSPRCKYAHSILCYCEGHCPDQASNGTCLAQPGGACFAAVEEMLDGDTNTNILEISYGCLPPDGAGLMQCKGSLVPHMNRKAIECCTDGDICNRRLDPQVPEGTRFPGNNGLDDGPTWKENGSAAGAILAAVLCVTALAVVAIIFLLCRRHRGRKRPPSPPHPLGSDCGEFPSDLSSGSGSGLPLLVQRTIGKQINFHTSVGKGRYGEVWLGRLRGEKVAVKVFFTTEEASWFRETEIYQTVLMRHDNILGFVGADIMGTGSWTQMLLVTHFHELGSLHDYLQTSVLDTDSLLLMAHSIASGLTHLHIDIVGTKGKPAIAHRDIKSKNILVKNDGRCCIADFGLAVRYVAERNEVDIASNTRVGTRRYMAPEVLDETLNPTNFEAFKMADMYSFGLVLWEMCRRCASGDKSQYVEEYALPYHDCVPHDPSFEDMYQVVCVKQVRPQISLRWEVDDVLSILARIMQECWHPNPPVRLTALRVKKTLTKFDPDASIKLV